MTNKSDLIVFTKDGTEKSFMNDFGSGITEYTHPTFEVKELPSNDWKDEDGEDIYVPPNGLNFNSSDLEFKMCYSGEYETFGSVLDSIIECLKSGFLAVKFHYTCEKWYACLLKSIGDFDVYSNKSVGDVVEYKITFKIVNHTKGNEFSRTFLVDDDGTIIIDEKTNLPIIAED